MLKVFGKHFWVVHLFFLAAVAWLAAHLATLMIQNRLNSFPRAPVARSDSPRPVDRGNPYEWYAPIPERNIFNPAEKGLKLLPLREKKRAALGAEDGGKKTSSLESFRLVGTITGPGAHSWAIFQEKTNPQQQIVHAQGEIQGWTLVKVLRDQVIMDQQGRREVLGLLEPESRPQPSAGSAPPPAGDTVQKLSANRFVVNREDITRSVGNINEFMSQARFRPHIVSGRPAGFLVSEIQPRSLMEKLGLRNNDIIKKVNGQVLTQAEEVVYAYSQLQRDSMIEIEIERGGRTEVLLYDIR
jgi:type II secretion system protein C